LNATFSEEDCASSAY